MKHILKVCAFSLMLSCGSGIPCGPLYPSGCPLWMYCAVVDGQFTCQRSNTADSSE